MLFVARDGGTRVIVLHLYRHKLQSGRSIVRGISTPWRNLAHATITASRMTDDTTGCSPECHKHPTAENFEYFGLHLSRPFCLYHIEIIVDYRFSKKMKVKICYILFCKFYFFIFFIVLTAVCFLHLFPSSFDLFHRVVKQEARAPDDANRRTDSTSIII